MDVNTTGVTHFQYSSLGLVLLVRFTTSAAKLVALAMLALSMPSLPTTPLQSGVFQGLLQYVHGKRFVMDIKK